MEISSISLSLRPRSPLASSHVRPPALLKVGCPVIDSPCGLASPKSPTAELRRNRPMVMAAATSTGRNSKQQQRDDVLVWKESHYALLGVPSHAPQEEIRSAYRRLALQYHPDVVPTKQMDTATKLFSQINGAYRTLSDPHQRKAYDDLNLLRPKAHKGRGEGFSSYPYSTPYSRAGQSRGRNWETDQCW